MSAINPSGSVAQSAASSASETQKPSETQKGGFNELDMDGFLQLLITEMQNQDPLDPMDNGEMLQQIGLIREIGATDQLSSTLTNFAGSQELLTGSGLIGRNISALSDDAREVTGAVDRVTVEKSEENGTRKVKVHVGEQTIDIRNIREILPE